MPRPDGSALLGCTVPRVFTPPLRELTPSTSLGFEVIDFARDVLGMELFPWQEWLLIHALELLPSGAFRFRKVVVLVARQNGKSQLLRVLALWRLYVDGARHLLGTAQDRSIAREQFLSTVDLAQEVEWLADGIANDGVVTSRGFERFELAGGERYGIAASNRRAGRGLSIDLVIMDELREQQSWDAWSAVSKTTNARPRGQLFALSNAGDASSIVLAHFRRVAHRALGDPDGLDLDPVTGASIAPEVPEGVDPDDLNDDALGIFEWSATPGCSVFDRDGWAQANPSLNRPIQLRGTDVRVVLLDERTVASDARSDPEWTFRTEVLCQWSQGVAEGPFPAGAWDACRDVGSSIKRKRGYGVGIDTSWDRGWTYLAVAGWRDDGLIHVEVIHRRAGTDWVRAALHDFADGKPLTPEGVRVKPRRIAGVALQAAGAPVSSVLADLEEDPAAPPIVRWQGPDLGRWCGVLFDRVVGGTIRHRGQPALNVAAAVAATKPAGEAWLWDRKGSPADISPLVAVTAALGALLAGGEQRSSAYDDSDLMVA